MATVTLINSGRRRVGIGPQSRHVQDKNGDFVPRPDYDGRVIRLDSIDDDLVEADAKRRGVPVERIGRKRKLDDAQALRLKNSATFDRVKDKLCLELVG